MNIVFNQNCKDPVIKETVSDESSALVCLTQSIAEVVDVVF